MIFTFYSYKGGVGRSMAMAAVAYLFAKRGLRVLAIDFDLEAPGLERYFFDGERCRAVRAQPGLLDLILDYRAALASEAAFAQGEFKNWRRYCTPAIHAGENGKVDLMTAGRREPETAMRDYALAVRSFDWQNFFHNAKGDLFFDWLRRRVLDRDGGYDVVLVDSRTGVTEMGGVCAYQLADTAVLLCAANYQNLEGTREVARDFRSDGVRALRRGRPLEIVAVPARIEANHPGRAEFLRRFRDELGVDGLPMELARAGLDYEQLAIPYLPTFAVAERLVGEAQADLPGAEVVDVFERLADALTLLAPPGSRLHGQREAALARLQGEAAPAPGPLLADTTRGSAGYDAFLDFGGDDREAAAQIAEALEADGCRTWLDRPGADVAQSTLAAEQALEYSQTLLVLFGRPATGELRARRIARARRLQDIAIVPGLLPGADPGALASFDLSPAQAVELRDWPAPEARQRLRDAVQAATRTRRRARMAEVEPAETCPYPGARAHGEDDAAFFFGREREVAAAVDLLARHRVLAITGPAQVGKTSMVRAGLIPALRAAAGADSARLRIVCLDLSGATPPDSEATAAADVLVLDGIDAFADGGSDEQRESRRQAIAALLRAAAPECRVVLVARGVEEPAPDAGRTDQAAIELEPLAGESLLRAIAAPAEKAGHLLEPGLAERLIESAGSARSAIAQIQTALARIWPERKRGWLTNRSLDAAGHLEGISFARWRGVLDNLEPGARAAANALFLRLTALSGRREFVGSPQPWPPLATVPLIAAQDPRALRDRLARAGMLDLYRPTVAAGARPAAAQVALTRAPPRYFDDEGASIDLKYLLWRDALAPQMRLWLDGKKDALLAGAALAEAGHWLGSLRDLLTKPEVDFLEASLAAQAERERLADLLETERRREAEALAEAVGERRRLEAREHERLQRHARGLRLGLVLFAVLFAGGLGAAGVAVWKWNQAKAAAMNAQAAQHAADAAKAEAEVAAKQAREELRISTEALASLQASRDLAQVSVDEINDAAVAAVNAENDSDRRAADERRQQALDEFNDAIEVTAAQCPAGRRVYLHIGGDEARTWALALATSLEKAGFVVPDVEVAAGPATNELRYFRLRERQGAEDAVRALQAAGVAAIRTKYVEGSENSQAIRPCHYEAWFAADGATPTPASVRPKIRYYRPEDAAIAEAVAKPRGYRALRGDAPLAGAQSNALAFSPDIAPAQRTEIAIAFVEAGYPLRAIRPARNVPDRGLVQMIASPTAGKCGLLTADAIRAGGECGAP